MNSYEDDKIKLRNSWLEIDKKRIQDIKKIEESCAGGVCSVGGNQSTSQNSNSGKILAGGIKATNKPLKVKHGSLVLKEELDGTFSKIIILETFDLHGEDHYSGVYANNKNKEVTGSLKEIVLLMGNINTLSESYKGLDQYGKNTIDHKTALDDMRKKTVSELLYIMKDASEAAINAQGMGDSSSEGYYLDEINYASMALAERRKGSQSDVPVTEECAGTFVGGIAQVKSKLGETIKRKYKKKK
jgi:hypothetical protein